MFLTRRSSYLGYRFGVSYTQSRRWIIIATGDHVTSEVRLVPASDPTAAPILVAPRQPGREYDVDEHDGTLFIQDRKSVVKGKSVSVRVDLGGRRIIKKNKHK